VCTVEPGNARDVGKIVSFGSALIERRAHFHRSSYKSWVDLVLPSPCVPIHLTSRFITIKNDAIQIKSGGHHANPSFSSTSGVQIALTRFNEVRYDPLTETVEFGSGLRFNDVYNALAPYNRSVAGPRVSGVGVGGFLLGGGEY